jgi:hypothetical protein
VLKKLSDRFGTSMAEQGGSAWLGCQIDGFRRFIHTDEVPGAKPTSAQEIFLG